MATDRRLWINAKPLPELFFQRIELGGGKFMSSYQANTQADFVKTVNVRSLPVFWATRLVCTIALNDLMITNAVPAKPQMHCMNIAGTDSFIVRSVGTVDNEVANVRNFKHLKLDVTYTLRGNTDRV